MKIMSLRNGGDSVNNESCYGLVVYRITTSPEWHNFHIKEIQLYILYITGLNAPFQVLQYPPFCQESRTFDSHVTRSECSYYTCCCCGHHRCHLLCHCKITYIKHPKIKIRTPKIFAVITLKCEQCGSTIEWARSCENVSYAICEQQRCSSTCTSAQSDQHLCCSLPR